MFNPDPKPTRERLPRNSAAWKRRVDELYERESGVCQGCSKWLFRNEAAPHHNKTYGSGGGDELSNLILLDKLCHIKIDSGELSFKGEGFEE